MTLKLFLPLLLILVSNCFYHVTTKSTPQNANPWLSLSVTYLVAGVISIGVFLLGSREALPAELKKLNWTALVLGMVIIGLELGNIFAYRAGWKISTASLVANICLACVLLVLGLMFYKETVTVRQLVGMAVCAVGLVLVCK